MGNLTVAYATDDHYFALTLVSMTSVAINNPGVHFILLHTGLKEETFQGINDLTAHYTCTVEFKLVDLQEFENLPLSLWVTVHAWFRIKLAEWFPNLDRILYLDCDTLVIGNLEALWNVDLGNNYVGVVEDIWNGKQYSRRLKMKSADYFNSGVILIACERWRQDHLFERMKAFCLNNPRKIVFCDQDTLNAVIDERKVILDPKFNLIDGWWRHYHYDYVGDHEEAYLKAREIPVIIHYTGCKPWQKGCLNAYCDQWWDYAAKTSIYPALKTKFLNSQPFHKKRPFFSWLLSFHYTLKGSTKIPTITILGKEFLINKIKK